MAEERLQPISLHHEMQRSYLEYAMSVIVGRALPDVRDGLKPVQRRILFAMYELGLTPDRPYRKCARVVGDVLGKYHPHGDQAVYDALVRLVQSFSSRYPILDGHGNFGSVDDDPPAAMRYTETRLASIAHQALLNEIGSKTVDFTPNFDGSQQEPSVLPAQLPFLLLNGCSGIAVGMATSIPPHNLNEIINGVIALIKNPQLSDEQLLKIIPGPDFPTGGEVLLGTGVRETYIKGRGSIPMRGLAHIEEIHPGKGKHRRSAIIITELPYQLSKAGWIEKLAEQVNEGKINGIADIRDESDREGMRIVVELRRDSEPNKVLTDLQRRTALQSNFGAILLALVDGQPKQLSLKLLLEKFLEYRELTLIRRTQYLLTKTLDRLEIVEGLTKALKNLRPIITTIENAKDALEAKAKLVIELKITEKQAEAVLAMPLRKLTNLEQASLYKEIKELIENKNRLELLLKNRTQLLETLIKELKQIKKQFGNPRRTRLVEGGDKLLADKIAHQRPNAELQRQQAYAGLPHEGRLLIQNDNQVKIVSPQILGRLHLNESCVLGEEPAPARLIWPIEAKPKILAITKTGRVALVKWEFAGQQPGLLEKFLPGGLEGETIINLIPLPANESLSLGLLSSDGRFKRIPIEEVLELSGRAATVLKLKNGVMLKAGFICHPNGEIAICTSYGRILKLLVNEKTMPLMGKLAQGPITMKPFPGEVIIGGVSWKNSPENQLVIITKYGQIKKINLNYLRQCERGDIGEICINLKKSKDLIDEVVDAYDSKLLGSIISSKGRNARLSSNQLNNEIINNFIQLKEDEYIQKIIPLIEPEKIS
ncbi:DNA topoisomerase (ATP-hydrolyzing) [Prochlorococcus sp. MIT 1307]|uniref:DNA gyrase/topoisomerase IV subunit A n=1 Tax=Prochlorococcus sp. MIT 1307 TaxID=3096219 RepID=UPI002A747D5F|nr:DNA topoisomerase (ATP-hydrolyzing) [Prochlorococcus sp. MIT 1307]